jgi:acyl-CoA dehydrogenase
VDAEDFEQVRQTVRDFVRKRVVPLEEQIDREDRIPGDLRRACMEMGLFGMSIPEAHGGVGLSMSEESRLVMELGYTTPALRSMFGTNNGIAGHVVLEGGTEEQRRQWLPLISSGEVVASFGLTEPGAGSDPSGIVSSAVRAGDDWVLRGVKRYITNAPLADLFMIFARSDPEASGSRGISVFLVPRGTNGLTVGTPDQKMGQFGASTADVYLDDARVPADSLVGGPDGLNRGWSTAMRCLAHGRIHIAALCVGMAERLVDESVEYARTREQSGKPIASFQLVQGLIADSVTEYMAGRGLVLEASQAYDSGSDRRVAPSAAKYFCSEMVGRVADRAVQVHGGAGYMRGIAVERFYRDARLFRIYEGTSQIQQVIIARNTIGPAADA